MKQVIVSDCGCSFLSFFLNLKSFMNQPLYILGWIISELITQNVPGNQVTNAHMNHETIRSLIQPTLFQGDSPYTVVRFYSHHVHLDPWKIPQVTLQIQHTYFVYCTISLKSNCQILSQASLFFSEQVISLHLGTLWKKKNEAFVFLREYNWICIS